jgi:hypothetical protein
LRRGEDNMQATEKYTDRRRNERRHDKGMSNTRNGNPRRSDARRGHARLNCSFEVSVPDYEGKTVNVSASGVYFEVTTNNMETFPPGTSIPLQMNTVTNTSEGQEIKLKLSGRGTVIRNCIIENPDRANSLGVALEFTEKLNVEVDND